MINTHRVITLMHMCKHSGNSNQASFVVSPLFATGSDSGRTAADINKLQSILQSDHPTNARREAEQHG